jgi:hypothetical protein
MKRVAVVGLALVVLAGCGGSGADEEMAACEEWVAAFDALFHQTEPLAEDSFSATNQAYVGTASAAEIDAQLEASAAEWEGVLAEIDALGSPPEHLASVVSLTREGLDLGRQGYELLLAGRQAGDSGQINEGGILLGEGSMQLASAAIEKETVGTCADPGE